MSNISGELQNKKQRLGRGLGSLISDDAAPPVVVAQGSSVSPESRIWQVGIEKLVPSPYQPRTQFEKEKLEELAQSIRQSGILQPIIARKTTSGAFEIIAGERRWRAAQLAGLNEVPVILKSFSHKETLEMALIENIQREDLNAIEEAVAFQRLISEFNLTQQALAEKVGKDRATITNSLRLLQLPQSIQNLLSEKKLSAGHAKVLLSIAEPKKAELLAKKIIDKNLSVRALEKEVQALQLKNKDIEVGSLENRSEKMMRNISEELQKLIGTKVSIQYKNGKGQMAIHFYSDEQLSQIIEKMKETCRP